MKNNKDPDIIAKNECVGALFAPITGRDPYLNNALRAGIDQAIKGESGSAASLDAFMRKAAELAIKRGGANENNFSLFHVNLRSRAYEPLWLRGELIDGLKPMVASKRSMLVVSGLEEAVRKALPRRAPRARKEAAMAEARRYIDAMGARFSASGSRMSILYLD